jgi:hypothetical protein
MWVIDDVFRHCRGRSKDVSSKTVNKSNDVIKIGDLLLVRHGMCRAGR